MIFGVNVYFRGDAEQRRFLSEALRPTARDARSSGLADRFWYKAFDARGPHLFALFHTDEARRPQLVQVLTDRLGAYLREHPSKAELSDEELMQRHRECRGKALCSVDAEPGLEPHNSLRLFEQPPDRYPFHLTRGMADADAFWTQMDRLSFWSLDRLDQGRLTLDAIQWVAHVDAHLERQGRLNPIDFWRYQACTLLVPLRERLKTEEAEVIAALPQSIGAKNLDAFQRVFDRLDAETDLFPGTGDLVAAAGAEDGRSMEQRRAVIREIVHATLIQLQQPVMRHIPLVLFAWQRRLKLAAREPVAVRGSRA